MTKEMDIKQIQELIKFVSKSGVNEVAIEQGEFKITIKTNQAPTFVQATIPANPIQSSIAEVVPPSITSSAPLSSASVNAVSVEDSSKYITIKSPMIGTFYRSNSPDKPSFVNVGDDIQSGQVLCIIEAMKLFNEIESEFSGKIVKILVENATPVEYDQPLFLIESV